MIAIKTDIKIMPDYCDECVWYTCKPHPYKGWTELCELMGECMDEDAKPGWIYDGNGRPQACPLVELQEKGKDTNTEL